MKAIVRPLYFKAFNSREMNELEQQINKLKIMYEEADILNAVSVEEYEEGEEDAVLFPILTGAVFSCKEEMSKIQKPVFVITSSFGTVEMWDWEIVAYLRENLGMNILTPYKEELAKVLFRAVAEKRRMKDGKKLLIFQDSPGEGMQAYIFKRFYWWEKECVEQIERAFGIRVEYRSWKAVNEMAKTISDKEAIELWKSRNVPCSSELDEETICCAVKLYMAIRTEITEVGDVIGVGSNCLNESMYSDTTPCLAWEWLFKYDNIMWCCEGDLVSLISMEILHSALKVPLMMTNLYPFLVGMAALKHEKIDKFPQIDDSDNCALGVHCGYFGFAPSCFCTKWTLKPKVLEIVNDRAVVVDCQMECGNITMAKLHSDMKKLTIIEAEILKYVQYQGSDCRNGCLIHYRNNSGYKVMENLSSHHAIILKGDMTAYILQLAKVYGFEVEIL